MPALELAGFGQQVHEPHHSAWHATPSQAGCARYPAKQPLAATHLQQLRGEQQAAAGKVAGRLLRHLQQPLGKGGRPLGRHVCFDGLGRAAWEREQRVQELAECHGDGTTLCFK